MIEAVTTRTGWQRHTVATAVGPLAVWEKGNGSVVVLRHGIFFDHTMWHGISNELADRHRVVLIDAPGHGESDDPGRSYTLSDDAHATVDILDRLGVDSATLVGHSWGGMSAVRTALLGPDRVHGLALIDTPLETSSPSGRARYHMLRLLALAVGTPLWYGAQVSAAMFSETSRRNDPALTTDLQRQLRRMSRQPLARAMDAVLVRPDTVIDRLGELSMPVQVLAGDEDYVLPETTRSALALALPDADVEVIPGKHVLPLEEPVGTLDHLERFLAKVRSTSVSD